MGCGALPSSPRPPQSGNTPLHAAAGVGNVELVRLLLEASGSGTTSNSDGLWPLAYAEARAKEVDEVKAALPALRELLPRQSQLHEEL